jgi:hypothetical protein
MEIARAAPSPAPPDGATLVVSPQDEAAGKRTTSLFDAQPDFPLVPGGPLFQLLRRVHLTGPALELLRQRTLIIVGLVWLPLFTLSVVEGHAWGGTAAVPFLWDVEAHARFLLALPLLIVAEVIVHRRVRLVVRQFLDRNLIPDGALPRLQAAIGSAFRLRDSVLAEAILIGLVYIVGIFVIWRNYVALSTTATWYAMPDAGTMRLTLTGWWYVFVSVPVYQFLLVRWYYRIAIWMRFLWQVSRIELSLIPTHPDRAGGLGFLSGVTHAFTPLAAAHGVMVAGVIANRIFYAEAALPGFKAEVVIVVFFLLCLVLGPLLVFSPQLAYAKRTGLGEYGTLAERYVRAFDLKWVRGGAPADEPFVGSADIQSLADLINSFEAVTAMRIAPITRDALLRVVGATLAPIVPLALTMMSWEELLKTLLGVLF